MNRTKSTIEKFESAMIGFAFTLAIVIAPVYGVLSLNQLPIL